MSLAMEKMIAPVIERQKLDADIGPNLVVIKGASADSVALPGGADVAWFGVTREDGKSGEYRDVVVGGVCVVKIRAAAAIAKGANVSVHGATGKIKTAAPAAGSNSHIVGMAMEAAGADGDLIGVLLARSVMQG